MPKPSGSPIAGGFRLFNVAGINVYLHWSWLLVAGYEISQRTGYTSRTWNALEYLALFAIVLLHEFGHALACRSVGGTADRIMLWPLGGVAYVRPPMRPGAMLWSIVAGPLVNVALAPILFGLPVAMGNVSPDLDQFLWKVKWMNVLLFCFNMLPIYPLDGGKIFQSLLWFFVGQARSLMIASVLGIVCAVGIIGVLLARSNGQPNIWLIVIGVYAISQSASGLKYARSLSKVMALPRDENHRCPSCKEHPPVGLMWKCSCGNTSDVFAVEGKCPGCGNQLEQIRCPLCGVVRPFYEWKGEPRFTPIISPTTPTPQPDA